MRGTPSSHAYVSIPVCSTAVIFTLLLIAWQSQAFSSLTKVDAARARLNKPVSGYVHGEVTRKTLCPLNLRNDFVLKVVDVNWRIDWDSNSKDVEAYAFGHARLPYRPNALYKPENHFDRNRDDVIIIGGTRFPDHVKPFLRGVAYVQSRRVIIVDGLIGRNGRNINDVHVAFGQALHALQDFFAHSNVTDLTEAEWNQVIPSLELVTGPIAPPPPTLKIAGFDKEFNDDFEKPEIFCRKHPFTPYGHQKCAKDDESFPEGKREMEPDAFKFIPHKTKFDRAKEAAVEFSIKWLQAIKTEVGPTNWAKIEDNGTSPCQLNPPQ
jgi:hypothetical protein